MDSKYVSFRKLRSVLGLAIIASVLAACNLPATPLPTPTPLPTNTPVPPLATPTPLPPTPTATQSPVNIVFATGTTAAVEAGSLQAGQARDFTLSVMQDQPMILIVDSPDGEVTLGVYRANGDVLVNPANRWTRVQWLLPATEVYTIRLTNNGASSETFSLTTKVAKRISFASGATSMTVNGSTLKGFVFTYAVTALANQTMTVSLNAPANAAYLDVFGLGYGQLLLDPADKAVTWTGVLPSTQDYIIEVIPSAGQVVNYSLTISIH